MPRTKPANYEDLLASMVADAIITDGDKIAAESGDPPGKRMSESEEVRLWGIRDPNVQYDATLQTMLTTGFGEMAEQLVVVQENPDLLDAYANPAPDPETASALAVLAEYPFRASLWNHYGDPDDRVAAADRINKAWLKRQPSGQAYLDMVEKGLDLSMPPGRAAPGAGAPVPVAPQPPPMAPGAAVPPELPATPPASAPDPALTVGG